MGIYPSPAPFGSPNPSLGTGTAPNPRNFTPKLGIYPNPALFTYPNPFLSPGTAPNPGNFTPKKGIYPNPVPFENREFPKSSEFHPKMGIYPNPAPFEHQNSPNSPQNGDFSPSQPLSPLPSLLPSLFNPIFPINSYKFPGNFPPEAKEGPN